MATEILRPIRVQGNLAYVPLTKGYEATIDAADVPLVEGFNWSIARRKNGKIYAQRRIPGGIVLMHRQITGAADGEKVDHRDNDGLNNRRDNLRPATDAENNQNKPTNSRNKSGFKGVSWFAGTRKWRATIQSNGKWVHLGYFTSAEDAHAAYRIASANLHGDFSNPGT